jgi:hypothetical protein
MNNKLLENITFRMDLEIPGQRLLSQYMSTNRELEEAISKGMEIAIIELTKDNNFETMIANETKNAVIEIVKRTFHSWEMERKLKDAVMSAVDKKTSELAEIWANQITKNLNPKDHQRRNRNENSL